MLWRHRLCGPISGCHILTRVARCCSWQGRPIAGEADFIDRRSPMEATSLLCGEVLSPSLGSLARRSSRRHPDGCI
jgi:hypothetical protein